MALPNEIVKGLPTTSAKIRALAAWGYERADIARFLNIRYQHVRNVLVCDPPERGASRSRISPGKRSIKRSDSDISMATDSSVSEVRCSSVDLAQRGFELLGCWNLAGDSCLTLSGNAPDRAGVYAFLVDDVIRYVGLTQRGLRSRLDGYVRGYERQRTNARVKKLLIDALAAGQKVDVMIAFPPDSEWNSWVINGSAGLEYGLIRSLQPLWNIQGARAVK